MECRCNYISQSKPMLRENVEGDQRENREAKNNTNCSFSQHEDYTAMKTNYYQKYVKAFRNRKIRS